MPKYLILKHYNGGPAKHPNFTGFSEWTPEEASAHMAFQRHVISRSLDEDGRRVSSGAHWRGHK